MWIWLSPNKNVPQESGSVTGGITDGAARRSWTIDSVSLGRWLRCAEPKYFEVLKLCVMQDLEAQTGLFSDNQWFQKEAALHIVFWNK